eukprot:SM000018S03613  [mRNA]  locus=s18:342383:347099:+ [translate_table: standard]
MTVTNGDFMPSSMRDRKIARIFQQFDANSDGSLNREEMSALVVAVNPNVKFTEDQISAILDEVFRTYGPYIDDDNGLSLAGLRQTYDDGAGDVNRDFDALKLNVDDIPAHIPGLNGTLAPGLPAVVDARGAGADGPHFETTWRLLEDLEIILKRHEVAMPAENAHGHDAVDLQPRTIAYTPVLAKELAPLRARADGAASTEAAFEGHMAMGKILDDRGLPQEALLSFQRAQRLMPGDARAHFRAGNALFSCDKVGEAKVAYQRALDTGREQPHLYAGIIPQVYVNMGIVLETEGMLANACEQYQEAAILSPQHHRALKLLGSAQFGLGDYRAAEQSLQHALYLEPTFADAHCDLGSTLHALGDTERAREEFEQANELQPVHLDAMYNLGQVYSDNGNYIAAADAYNRVLARQPDNWKAELNRAVALLGAGRVEESHTSFQSAFQMTDRVELYDAIQQLKRASKKNKALSSMLNRQLAWCSVPDASPTGSEAERQQRRATESTSVVVDLSRMKQTSAETTPPKELGAALDVRSFQKQTRLHTVLAEAVNGGLQSHSLTPSSDRMLNKASMEKICRALLPKLSPQVFQQAMRALNVRIFALLDDKSGKLDLGMFLAIIAPLCSGTPEQRKQCAFNALSWNVGRASGVLGLPAAKAYFQLLRQVYLAIQHDQILDLPSSPNEDINVISFAAFDERFSQAFPILPILIKLEEDDRVRHGRQSCAVCSHPIVGLRYKEISAGFSICSHCYSEGRVPSIPQRDDYLFKEYSRAESFLYFGMARESRQ